MSLNSITLSCEVVGEPETRHTNSDQSVVRVAVRTNDDVRINVVCWGSFAEIAPTLGIGSKLLVGGSLNTVVQRTQAGQRKFFEVVVRRLHKVDGHLENLDPMAPLADSKPKSGPGSTQSQGKSEDLSDVFAEEEDDIPF